MSNCVQCKYFLKLKHAEGCQKYKKVLLTLEKECRGYEFDPGKFFKSCIDDAQRQMAGRKYES